MTARYSLRAFQVPSPGAAPALIASSLRDLSPKAFAAYAMGEHACACIDHASASQAPCTAQPLYMTARMTTRISCS